MDFVYIQRAKRSGFDGNYALLMNAAVMLVNSSN